MAARMNAREYYDCHIRRQTNSKQENDVGHVGASGNGFKML